MHEWPYPRLIHYYFTMPGMSKSWGIGIAKLDVPVGNYWGVCSPANCKLIMIESYQLTDGI